MLDTDLQFRADIKDLFALFDSMSERAIMALATDQQPVYRFVVFIFNQYFNIVLANLMFLNMDFADFKLKIFQAIPISLNLAGYCL